MNARERMLAAFDRRPLDRVPTDIWAVPEVRAKLADGLGPDWAGALHIDGIAAVGASYVGPPLPEVPDDGRVDFWGVRTKKVTYQGGDYYERSHEPLAAAETIDDLEAYPWPSADWFDYAPMRAAAEARRKDQSLKAGYMAPFYQHNKLRGLETSLTDPLLKPEFTHHLLKRACDFIHEHHRRMFQACEGLVDVTEVTDDFGAQSGPLISLDVFREFYRPQVRRFIDLAGEFGIRVFHHDDGAMRPFLPDLVDMGIAVLNPIQWRCPGMEIEGLKRDFGGRICFHGGVDNQQTLPFGSEADVRAEVRRLIDVLAADGTGYVLAPCHNIQAVTPLENIVAMYDEAHHYGRF